MQKPLFHRLLSDEVQTAEIDPRTVDDGLVSAERAAIQGAAPVRVAQFTAGRVCGRLALSRFGAASTTPILQGEDRAPIWPNGYVGSISHTDAWCGAAVARDDVMRSVGIDLEPATPLKEALWRRVCTPAERDRLRELPNAGLMGKILFSAKESVYKCQYTITAQFLGFHAVEIEVTDGAYRAVFQQPAGEFQPGDVIDGKYLVEDGVVATACELRA